MAWESRKGSSGSYYTRSLRVKGKVVREYIGTGPTALAIAELDALDRQQRHHDQINFKVEKEAQRSIDRKIDEETKIVQTMTDAVLLVNGYHYHKGQWRKKRYGSKETS